MCKRVYTCLCMQVRVSSVCLETAMMLYVTLGWTSFNNKKYVFCPYFTKSYFNILLNLEVFLWSFTLEIFFKVSADFVHHSYTNCCEQHKGKAVGSSMSERGCWILGRCI